MALRGFAGFGDDGVEEAERSMYTDWWGQIPGVQLTEEVRPEVLEAERMQAAAATAVPLPGVAPKPTTVKAGAAPPALAKRVLTPLLIVGGLGLALMLFTSGKKKSAVGGPMTSNARTKKFHVYAEDGFESAHASEASAVAAARRGSKRRALTYRVMRTSRHGLTGGGHGTVVAEYMRGRKVA